MTRERFTLEKYAVYHYCGERNGLGQGVAHYESGTGNKGSFPIDTRQPALGQFARRYNLDLYRDCPREHPKLAARIATLLANTQRVEPVPAYLRGYSDAPQAGRMGDRGENFAALVNAICQDETKTAYLSWLQELRPEEVTDVGVLRGALGEPLFVLREGGREFSRARLERRHPAVRGARRGVLSAGHAEADDHRGDRERRAPEPPGSARGVVAESIRTNRHTDHCHHAFASSGRVASAGRNTRRRSSANETKRRANLKSGL